MAWPSWDGVGAFSRLIRHPVEGYYDINRHNILDSNIVWIIDEEQMTYGDDEFWLAFVKFQQGHSLGPQICVFSSYGSPTNGAEGFRYVSSSVSR